MENYSNMVSEKNQKLKTIIIISIIILSILCCILIILAAYKKNNPSHITTYIDGKKMSQSFEKILDVQKDENGKTQMYIDIKKFAEYMNNANEKFGYKAYTGNYYPTTEEKDKCYVVREKHEVVMFENKSNIIYKKNLEDGANKTSNEDYEDFLLNHNVFSINDNLYASIEGIEKGYNVQIKFDEKTKTLRIYTLDKIITTVQEKIKKKEILNYGVFEIEDKNYNNWKTAFEDLLIVKSEDTNKYGLIKSSLESFILEPQYDNIEYISNSKKLLVEGNKKKGLYDLNGKRMIDMIYDEITPIGLKSDLFKVKVNKNYGVVNNEGKNVVYPQYTDIGLKVTNYSVNNVKNGYILLDDLIPVKQEKKWSFYSIKNSKFITDTFKYTNIGCSTVKSGNNIYSLMIIPELEYIVVGDDKNNFWFMDKSGNDDIFPHVLEQVYLQLENGEPKYYFVYNDTEINIIEYLNKRNKKE